MMNNYEDGEKKSDGAQMMTATTARKKKYIIMQFPAVISL